MRAALASVLFYLHLMLASITNVAASQNFEVPWSKKNFGTDGPWQAVLITTGGNQISLSIKSRNTLEFSVYLGGSYESMTFTASACE